MLPALALLGFRLAEAAPGNGEEKREAKSAVEEKLRKKKKEGLETKGVCTHIRFLLFLASFAAQRPAPEQAGSIGNKAPRCRNSRRGAATREAKFGSS